MKQLNLFIGLMLCSLLVFPQAERGKSAGNSESEIEIQYDHFRQTFEQEMGKTKPDTLQKIQTKREPPLAPSLLPGWIFNFDSITGTEGAVVLGISDPGLDSATALKQAKIRALGLLAIFNGAVVRNLTDNYATETVDNDVFEKFSSFSQVIAETKAGLKQLKVLREGFTAYGEAIVMAGFSDTLSLTENNPTKVTSDYFMWEEGDQDALKVYNTYHFQVTCPGEFSTAFACYNTKRSILISSVMDSVRLEFDYGRFKYFTRKTGHPDDETLLEFTGSKMSEGLWNAYLSAVLRQIEMSEKQTSEMKRIDDQFKGKMRELNREISKIRYHFNMAGIDIKDDELFVKLSVFK